MPNKTARVHEKADGPGGSNCNSSEVHLYLLDRKKFVEIVASFDDGANFEFYHKLALLRYKRVERIKYQKAMKGGGLSMLL